MAIGAGAGEDFADAVDGRAAAEFVDDRIDEGEILLDEVAKWHFLVLAEVDQRAIEAVADGGSRSRTSASPNLKIRDLRPVMSPSPKLQSLLIVFISPPA